MWVNEKDLAQINQRSVLLNPQFKQVWNHTENDSLSDLPSKDWLFIDAMRISNYLTYQISSLFPLDDGIGYSKFRVPLVPFCLQIPVLNAYSCPLFSPEIYHGVMLGDVNGSYQNIAKNGLLRANNKVIFDIAEATINGDSVVVPVLIRSSNSINALDFSIKFNESKLSYNSISSPVFNMQMLDYLNPKDETLRFTSNCLQSYPTNEPIFFIRFRSNDGKINANDLMSIKAYLNGEPTDIEVRIITKVLNSNRNINASIYPNPTQGLISVIVKEDANLQLIDINGKILDHPVKLIANQRNDLNLDQLARGIYLMKISNNRFNETHKIIINN